MKHTGTQFLFSYWDEIRKGRASPDRRDIDLAAIRPVLSDTILIEVDEDGRYPLRSTGARFSALFARELQGRSFVDCWASQDRQTIRTMLDNVVNDAQPAVAGVYAAPREREPLHLELLLLPLRNFGKTHSRLLGALSPTSIPQWLGLLPIEALHMTSLRLIEPGERPAPFLPAASAEPAAKRVRHLRVISGGKDRMVSVRA